jgi:transposase, IS5 family
VRDRERGQRGPKVYSLHAPEVECIGKGKPHKPYEFGVKVSVATTLKPCKGGQFVTHVRALPGNPHDGHTLVRVIPAIEALIGQYHRAAPHRRRLPRPQRPAGDATPHRHRAVIGHLKSEHCMDRNYPAGRNDDANNAIPAVGYSFRRLIRCEIGVVKLCRGDGLIGVRGGARSSACSHHRGAGRWNVVAGAG